MHYKKEQSLKGFALFLFVITSIFMLSACGGSKRIGYFKNIPDTLTQPMVIKHSDYQEPVIQANDILSVKIQTIGTQASDIGPGNASEKSEYSGYMVDKEGNIELPMVGRVKVVGLTTSAAREAIRAKVDQFYKDAVVNVMFANFQITVLGEVNKPAKYVIANERVSVLDAIGLAGDMTPFGKRDNVLLIREERGSKVFVRFNLNSTDVFQSPYFYLRQGDQIYVEPNKSRSRTATTDSTRDRYITYTASILSVLLSAFAIFLR